MFQINTTQAIFNKSSQKSRKQNITSQQYFYNYILQFSIKSNTKQIPLANFQIYTYIKKGVRMGKIMKNGLKKKSLKLKKNAAKST